MPDPKPTTESYRLRGLSEGESALAAGLHLAEPAPAVFPPPPTNPIIVAKEREAKLAARQAELASAESVYRSAVQTASRLRHSINPVERSRYQVIKDELPRLAAEFTNKRNEDK